MEVDRSALGAKVLVAFFAFLPFTYALQVLTRNSYAPLLGYVFLAGSMTWLLKRPHNSVHIGRPDALSVGFLLLIIHHTVMCWVVAGPGEAGLIARVLVLFTVPLILFWVPRTIDLGNLEQIISFSTIAALVVSVELLYENISTQIFEKSAFFQLLNKAYLHEVLGTEELGQLWWPGYRATGLIEHPHATALYCNIGLCMATMLYVYRNQKFYLLSALIGALAVWTQGFRVPVVSQFVVIALLGAFVCLGGNMAVRRRIAIFLSLYTLTIIFVLVVDPTHVAHRYYRPGVQGYFNLPENMDVGRWIGHTGGDLIRQNYLIEWLSGGSIGWQQALFGHGVIGTISGRFPFSDDMFLLALPLQYGILGFIVFSGIWIVAIATGIDSHIRCQNLQVPAQIKMLALISLSALLLLALSMAHSGVLQRKAIYPLFPFFIGVLTLTRKEHQKIAAESQQASHG